MARYLLQYDLDSVHIRNRGQHRSAAYRILARELEQRGWAKYEKDKTFLHAQNDANHVAVYLEAQFGNGVFVRLDFERYLYRVR